MRTARKGHAIQQLAQTKDISLGLKRTNKTQRITAIAIHARGAGWAYIHSSIEVEVLAVANDGALRICISTVCLDESV